MTLWLVQDFDTGTQTSNSPPPYQVIKTLICDAGITTKNCQKLHCPSVRSTGKGKYLGCHFILWNFIFGSRHPQIPSLTFRLLSCAVRKEVLPAGGPVFSQSAHTTARRTDWHGGRSPRSSWHHVTSMESWNEHLSHRCGDSTNS